MIEFLFAVALGVGSVVLATISIGELVEGSKKEEHEIIIPADNVFDLMTSQNENIYVKGKLISTSYKSGSIETSEG